MKLDQSPPATFAYQPKSEDLDGSQFEKLLGLDLGVLKSKEYDPFE